MKLLVGVTNSETALAIRRHAPRVDRATLHFLTEGELVAVLASLPRSPFRLLTRQSGLKDLVRLQRILEAILPHGPLLAARPGTRADDERVLQSLLMREHARLVDALRSFGHDLQFQITVLWDGAAILAAAAENPELRASVVAAGDGRSDAGADMLAHIHRLRDMLQARLRELLAPAVREIATLPLAGEDMVANLTVRIRRGDEAALEAALQPLDALLPGNSRIKLIGPLPAVSFASLQLEKIDRDSVDEARRLLGVSPRATLAELRAAYYQLAQDHHPDVVGEAGDGDLVGRASRAYKLLKTLASQSDPTHPHDTILDIQRPDVGLRRVA